MQLKTKDEAEAAAAAGGNLQEPRRTVRSGRRHRRPRTAAAASRCCSGASGIGYGRAARLIDFMAEDGIVGQYNGCQAREVMISIEDWERMQGLDSTAANDSEDDDR